MLLSIFLMSFSSKILGWYAKNKRELPWRSTSDPYKIWLSEIMLQQTRVAQGMPYYLRFVEVFPTVYDLADSNEANVLKLWQGLGYYSRARNMHTTAKTVVNDFGGKFPGTYSELIKLKGVGDYTASAIASICFDEAVPVVDGNVFRLLSRYFGVDLPINNTRGVKYFKRLAKEVMDSNNIRDYNQAIMEFGAMQCTPKNPVCDKCPLNDSCKALKDKKVDKLPLKLSKPKIRIRHFNYLVPFEKNGDGSKTLLEQRKGKGIWQNLYQFPLMESDKEVTAIENFYHFLKKYGIDKSAKMAPYNEKPIVHKLSHQHLYTKFWIVETKAKIPNGIATDALNEYPVPVLIADFINAFKF